jgi:ABC-2 type transport system ATP-binding protein
MENTIKTINISREFIHEGKVFRALDNVNIDVPKGVIYGLLGPNGAGKTTLIRILTTLLLPTSGEAYVGGYHVVKDAEKVRKIINLVSGGERPGYGILTVRENLLYFGQVYGLTWSETKKRIDELDGLLGLSEFLNKRLNTISTGMMQKYSLARGLINNPEILFLDEPTLGLDVENARHIRKVIRRLVDEGRIKTIFMTSHYMAEVEELCDIVSIIHMGKIIATGSPDDLKKLVRDQIIYSIVIKMPDIEKLGILDKFESIIAHTVKTSQLTGEARIRMILSREDISQIIRGLEDRGIHVLRVSRDEISLEDVFLKLVGRGIENEYK